MWQEIVGALLKFLSEQRDIVVVAVGALVALVALVALFGLYLRARDQQATAAAEAAAKAVAAAQEALKEVVRQHGADNRALAECMRGSLNELTGAFDRSNHDHRVEARKESRELFRDIQGLTERMVAQSLHVVEEARVTVGKNTDLLAEVRAVLYTRHTNGVS